MNFWTSATKFQTDLIKNLVENMNVDKVKVKCPAFKVCLSNKISNLKHTHNKNVDKRGKSELPFGFFILTFSFQSDVNFSFSFLSKWTPKTVGG